MSSYALQTPADPDLLTTARLFVASAARLLGCDDEALEDLKLATSEAASSLMGAGGPIRTTVTAEASRIRVAVFGPGEIAASDPSELVLGLELARALLGDLTVAAVDGGTEITFGVGTT